MAGVVRRPWQERPCGRRGVRRRRQGARGSQTCWRSRWTASRATGIWPGQARATSRNARTCGSRAVSSDSTASSSRQPAAVASVPPSASSSTGIEMATRNVRNSSVQARYCATQPLALLRCHSSCRPPSRWGLRIETALSHSSRASAPSPSSSGDSRSIGSPYCFVQPPAQVNLSTAHAAKGQAGRSTCFKSLPARGARDGDRWSSRLWRVAHAGDYRTVFIPRKAGASVVARRSELTGWPRVSKIIFKHLKSIDRESACGGLGLRLPDRRTHVATVVAE